MWFHILAQSHNVNNLYTGNAYALLGAAGVCFLLAIVLGGKKK